MKTLILCLLAIQFLTSCSIDDVYKRDPSLIGKEESMFDGRSTEGWQLMAVHGGNGGVWTVEDGVLVAAQDQEHKGGLLGTRKKYSDFKMELEFKVDFPVDTGVYLRTDKSGIGYQVTIDHRKDGLIGSIYIPEDGGLLTPSLGWENAFKKNDWNKLKIQITDWPAHITVWLNGMKTVEYIDTKKRYARDGYIGLQVHTGADVWGPKNKAYFKNIRITEL